MVHSGPSKRHRVACKWQLQGRTSQPAALPSSCFLQLRRGIRKPPLSGSTSGADNRILPSTTGLAKPRPPADRAPGQPVLPNWALHAPLLARSVVALLAVATTGAPQAWLSACGQPKNASIAGTVCAIVLAIELSDVAGADYGRGIFKRSHTPNTGPCRKGRQLHEAQTARFDQAIR